MFHKGDFQVFIYESEYRKIQAWVDKYQHLETGGDLFGLWADHRTAVVQLVLGPGKHCRRTSVSFYQDVDYLDRVRNLLTKEEGLCHIGEWHSHHRLGLSKPSGGDENTVWTNMDRYDIHRFFLFIANIKEHFLQDPQPSDVTVGCFLFESDPNTGRRKPVLEGKFEYINDESQGNPFREKVAKCLSIGAENCEETNKKSNSYTDQQKNATTPNKGGRKEKSNETPLNQEIETSGNADMGTGPSKDSNRSIAEEKETLPSVGQQQNSQQNGTSSSGLDDSYVTQDRDQPSSGTDGDTNDTKENPKKERRVITIYMSRKQDMKKSGVDLSDNYELRNTKNPNNQEDVISEQESDDGNGKQPGSFGFLCGVGNNGKGKKKKKPKMRGKK